MMFATRPLYDSLRTAFMTQAKLAALDDTPNMLVPIKSNFTPALNMVLADVTLDLTILGAVEIGVEGSTLDWIDPPTGDNVGALLYFDNMQFNTLWKAAITPPIPIEIYGIALVNNAVNELLAIAKFPAKITISKSDQGIVIPMVTFQFPQAMMS